MIEFKAFLSHRYKSPEVNLYFFKLFSKTAEVQFEIDRGTTIFNMTRIERLIRNSDAFIGIYPHAEDPKKHTSPQELREASKNFRLECDLAIRSQKPAMIFLDKRYSQLFSFPENIRAEHFDIQEVTGKGGSPKWNRYKRIFKEFCDEVDASMNLSAAKEVDTSLNTVGIILPDKGPKTSRYEKSDIDKIIQVLEKQGIQKVKHFPWPPILDGDYLSDIEALDWVIVDIGDVSMKNGIIGYLHGRFIPQLRLLKSHESAPEIRARYSHASLFGSSTVGYIDDIIAWKKSSSLEAGIKQRLAVIKPDPDRISSQKDAETYFRTAALRKEAVFLSYSGKDTQIATNLSSLLKKRFQQVFDYKDGESIRPGESWLQEIFDTLSSSSLGVPLISKDYLSSGHCMHEVEHMVNKRNMKQMTVIPVMLYEEEELPSFLKRIQYLNLFDLSNPEICVAKILDLFDRKNRQYNNQN